MASGKSSRAKGVRGKREAMDAFEALGFTVSDLQNNVADCGDFLATRNGITLRVEMKLRKRIDHRASMSQVASVTMDGEVATLAYRYTMPPGRRAQPLCVAFRMEDFARLLGS